MANNKALLSKQEEQKKEILSIVEKSVYSFLYEGTKDYPPDLLLELIQNKVVTTSDIINQFARTLRKEVEK